MSESYLDRFRKFWNELEISRDMESKSPFRNKDHVVGLILSTDNTSQHTTNEAYFTSDIKSQIKPRIVHVIPSYFNPGGIEQLVHGKTPPKKNFPEYWLVYIRATEEDKILPPWAKAAGKPLFDLWSPKWWKQVFKHRTALIPRETFPSTPAMYSTWMFKYQQGGPLRGDYLNPIAVSKLGAGVEQGTADAYDASGGISDNPPSWLTHTGYDGELFKRGHGMKMVRCINGAGQFVDSDHAHAQAPADPALHKTQQGHLKRKGTYSTGKFTIHRKQKISWEEANREIPWFNWDVYQFSNSSKESSAIQDQSKDADGRSSDPAYSVTNKYGYIGAYQMGYAALYTTGYLPFENKAAYNTALAAAKDDHGSYSRETTQAMFAAVPIEQWEKCGPSGYGYYSQRTIDAIKSANGDGEMIMNAWLADAQAQDDNFAKYTIMHMRQLTGVKDVDFSNQPLLHGLLMAAHLKGFGAAKKYFEKNEVQTDANDTSTALYFEIASNNALSYDPGSQPC